MNLIEQRRTIRHLLDEHNPADAMAGYFAFYYADNKTTLRPYPTDAPRAQGYICLSQTGMDLFRPLATMRLPLAIDVVVAIAPVLPDHEKLACVHNSHARKAAAKSRAETNEELVGDWQTNMAR